MPLSRRSLFLASALLLCALISAGSAQAATSLTEAETMSGTGITFADAAASGGRALLIQTNATATAAITTAATRRITVRVRGDQCNGAPQMAVAVDGRRILSQAVPSAWTSAGADVALANGAHTVAISLTNDATGSGCDRALRIDTITASSTAAAPFAGKRFYLNPDTSARRQVDAWLTSRPTDAAQVEKIAGQPQAEWFGGWNTDVASDVRRLVDRAQAAGQLPVLVAYNIPQRDCGAYSAGGATSADGYKTWIRRFADGIGSRSAAVLLEPDALAGLGCLTATDRDRRLALLRDAVAVLSARPGVSVYLDGGHAAWLSTSDMASRLRAAGVADAQGFALNVSNFVTSGANATYGQQVAALTGGTHFVIDTSRNGLGGALDGAWCNPAGRALGLRPGTSTGVWRQDANLWVKHPGESDGTCNGGPAAGQWWADYALGLAQRAAY